ncbi:hypothetical protein [Armatimonas sp.]|uniref:hypothetical protein n=1 Tax=Armatimonas sp. TaxID=1872638 RepID=UPI00374DC92B
MQVTNWMSWEGGVDMVATTVPGGAQPNVIVHLGRIVHTPLGSAASGMVFYQPDPSAAPLFMGFVSTDPQIGAYFGPNIFAGTPFESAPTLEAQIEVFTALPDSVGVRVKIEGFEIETTLSELGPLELVERPFGAPLPFVQQGVEAAASQMTLTINGESITIYPVPVGLAGGPSASWSPTGVYSR